MTPKKAESKKGLSSWEDLAQDLQDQGGFAQVALSEEQQQMLARGFSIGRAALNIATSENTRCIRPTEDSAHATGYHAAASSNSMSRYNAHREGFVFSDGAMLSMQDTPEFQEAMMEMQHCLHEVAKQALAAIEQHFNLPEHWFRDNFHHDEDHSQWHLKRYVTGCDKQLLAQEKENGCKNKETQSTKEEEEKETVLLPSHTDPSLLSVVILDRPGMNPGAMGLQCHQKVTTENNNSNNKQRVWRELHFHGHALATIFVGSVLSHITGARYPSVKHRVVQRPGAQDRMAATFFLRPSGKAILKVPPSPLLEYVTLKKQATFDAWSSRVSRHYMKNKVDSSTNNDGPNRKNSGKET